MGIRINEKNLEILQENTQAVLSTYHLGSQYGLFRRMTGLEGRDELVFYGSDDRHDWKVYEFYHKPTKTDKMPTFIAPHQPRLDWQLWFSALSPGVSNRDGYLNRLILKLFTNSTSVKTLLAKNPFPDYPPSYIKINKITYSFTDFGKD